MVININNSYCILYVAWTAWYKYKGVVLVICATLKSSFSYYVPFPDHVMPSKKKTIFTYTFILYYCYVFAEAAAQKVTLKMSTGS